MKTTASAIVVSHDDQAATDFAAMDTNGDGVVSREEFVAAKLKEAAENDGAQAEAAATVAAAALATVEDTVEGQGGEGGASFATEEWLQVRPPPKRSVLPPTQPPRLPRHADTC